MMSGHRIMKSPREVPAVSEIILSTVSTYILGNSIEQFTVIIALMLLMSIPRSILVLVLAINVASQSLRDIFDPRFRE